MIEIRVAAVDMKFEYFDDLVLGWPTQIGLWAATWKICQRY
jgi:hypothetical protein